MFITTKPTLFWCAKSQIKAVKRTSLLQYERRFLKIFLGHRERINVFKWWQKSFFFSCTSLFFPTVYLIMVNFNHNSNHKLVSVKCVMNYVHRFCAKFDAKMRCRGWNEIEDLGTSGPDASVSQEKLLNFDPNRQQGVNK